MSITSASEIDAVLADAEKKIRDVLGQIEEAKSASKAILDRLRQAGGPENAAHQLFAHLDWTASVLDQALSRIDDGRATIDSSVVLRKARR